MKAEEAPEHIFVFDTETSGTDIENDRILTCYAMVQDRRGNIVQDWHWTIDPGIEVPQGASDVHGMTTEYIREHGRKDVAIAIREIYDTLWGAALAGQPIVAYNGGFDLGLLDRELRRHGVEDGLDYLEERAQFFDPICYDRATDKYRKGNRKLVNVAEHYGVEVDESRLHEAEYDVILTAKVAWRMIQRSKPTMLELQSLQKKWKHDWATHLTEYFDSKREVDADGKKVGEKEIVDGHFPFRKFGVSLA